VAQRASASVEEDLISVAFAPRAENAKEMICGKPGWAGSSPEIVQEAGGRILVESEVGRSSPDCACPCHALASESYSIPIANLISS